MHKFVITEYTNSPNDFKSALVDISEADIQHDNGNRRVKSRKVK